MADENVLAIGLAGSLARGDVWDGSDIDLEVIVRGERPYVIFIKFGEVQIDFAYFNESQVERLPYDAVPIYDPNLIIEKVLKCRDLSLLKLQMIDNSMEKADRRLSKAKTFLDDDRIYSCLSFVHLAAGDIAEAFVLLMGEAPTIRRTISRFELAVNKRRDNSLFEKYLSLYNMKANLAKADFFYNELKNCYEKIWDSLVEKGIGSIQINPESTFQLFLRNRIDPVYQHDKRDFIWFAFHEFSYMIRHFFKVEEWLDKHTIDKTDMNKSTSYWVNRYQAILETISLEKTPTIYQTAKHLMEEVKTIKSTIRFLVK